jgi:hypothetical protein
MQPLFMNLDRHQIHGKDSRRTADAQVTHTSPEPASILRWEDDGGAAIERGHSGNYPKPGAAQEHQSTNDTTGYTDR